MDKHLSLPSLYEYQLATGYFRVVEGGVECYPKFPSEFGGHGLSLCYGFLYEKLSLVRFGRPVRKTATSSPPWSYAEALVCNGAKTGLVWRFLKFSFGSCDPAYRAPV